jgi:hypothetical protein
MITVTINDPIVIDDRREHFKIAVEYMHGDADAYSTETFFVPYSNMVELEVMIRCLEFMSSDEYPDTCDAREQRTAAAAFASSRTEHIDLYSRTLENLRTHDTTDGGFDHYAALEDFTVTYFDSQNIERAVQYTLEGDQ